MKTGMTGAVVAVVVLALALTVMASHGSSRTQSVSTVDRVDRAVIVPSDCPLCSAAKEPIVIELIDGSAELPIECPAERKCI